ncbi:MAG TPA: amidohydrolase [Vicinamibacteria bacterium]|jgi:5-methylthioadenosine/S-adenosylhomocysteine deaminase
MTFLPLVLLSLLPPQAEVDLLDLLIRGGTVVTMDAQERVLEEGAVAIRGDRIVSILEAGAPLPAARETLDATGHLVIPGLVNAHGHAAMTLLRGIADDLKLLEWLQNYIFPAESKNVSPEFVYWGTLLGCIEMARSGTTTYVDMYMFEEEAARATERAGIRGVLGQSVIGFPVPDYRTPEEALAGARAFIQRYRDHPLIIPSVAPHALYTTPMAVVERARDLAREFGVPLQIHAVEPPEENDQMVAKLGKRTIDALADAGVLGPGTILHHAIWLSPDDIKTIARYKATTSHNPESNMKTASGVSPVPDLLAAGVPVGLGTDGPASNNNLDMFEEMDTAAKLHKLVRQDATVMPAKTVFRMATIGGAKALGIDDRLGSLEPGKLADVVLLDARVPELTPLYDVYSHLVYVAKGGDVATVVVNGKVVVRNRHMETVDEGEVMKKANELKARILSSLGRP